MKNNLYVGLDIGSSAIRMAVGQQNPNDNEFYLIAAAEVPAMGITKGAVVSIEDVVSSITSCLEQAERIAGQPINHAYVGVSGTHISTLNSKGVVAVSRADNEVTESDILRAIEASQTIATPPNYEILHVVPKNFSVDNQTNIKDPLGMTGVRLEVETQIIQGLSAQIKNLTKAVFRTGLAIDDLVLGILACSEACLNRQQKELGVVLVNIGSTTTSMAVFEEGDIVATHVLPVGSAHITADIAIGLRVSLETAELIKLAYGQAESESFNKKEEINLSEFDDKENENISLKYVAEIIEARTQEIFSLVDKKLIEINRSGLLPAGVVLTGGGAKLPGIVNLAKKEFRLPASLGILDGLKTAIDKVNDSAYTTAAGLVFWGYQVGGQKNKTEGFKAFNIDSYKNILGKIKDWLKSLLP
ncbi:MAG TPA: cell division protein FtsA [bacterium]|nr:cell division protein FtsA [bacterium]